jgi:hypothetical protein
MGSNGSSGAGEASRVIASAGVAVASGVLGRMWQGWGRSGCRLGLGIGGTQSRCGCGRGQPNRGAQCGSDVAGVGRVGMQTRTERTRTSGNRRSGPPSSCTAARSRRPLPPGTAPAPSLRNSAVPSGRVLTGYSQGTAPAPSLCAVLCGTLLRLSAVHCGRGEPQSRCRCGRGEPGRGADVAGVGPVPMQMRQGRAQSRRSCGRGEPSRSADVGGVSPSPGPSADVGGASLVPSQCRCGRGEPSPGADGATSSFGYPPRSRCWGR